MKYLVCQFKDDGFLFVTTRQARETMLSVLLDMNQEIESVVLKEFPTFIEANNYKKEIEAIDKKLDELL